MPTKSSSNLTAFDDFLNVYDKAKPAQDKNVVPVVKIETPKKPANNPPPKSSKSVVNKTQPEAVQTVITPVTSNNLVPENEIATEESKEEGTQPQTQIQRIGFSTILKPDLIRKLKLKALNDDIDIYEAVEKAIELYINL